jgi:hypothetical protein
MALTLTLSSLSSRTTRLASTAGAGVRRLAINATTTQEDDGGLITNIYNAINRFGGSLMANTLNAFKGIFSFSWSAVWGLVVSATLYIFNFNWNATDAELDAQIKQAEIGIAAATGSLAGRSLGYAVCGLIPTAAIAVFNEAMALHVLRELGEEAAEEIAESFAVLLRLQFQQQVRKGFTALFKNYRTLLRGAATGFANLLVTAGILTQESVDKANKKRNEPWTLAGALEDSIESIKDPIEQAYAEEFYEEFADACIESGYIVAGSIDSYFAQQKIANDSFFGSERIIEIQPIRTEDNTPETVAS